jgi:AraC family transcriptional regulator
MKLTTRNDYLDRIRRVLRFVQEHLDERLAPDRLASVANLSRYHFHRIFSGLVGESLGAHVRRLRLERAAGELRRSDRAVIDVALDAGYEAHEPFTRAFREHFGTTPSAYRKLDEPLVFPPVLCGVHYGSDAAVSRFVPLQEDTHMIDVRLESHPAVRLLAKAHSGDYQSIGAIFGQLIELAAARGLVGPDTTTIGIYYDDPETTPAEQLRSHACMTVPESLVEVPAGCELLTLDQGECAVGVHRGPYTELHRSYAWLFGQWLPSSGREAANAPCHEVYVNDARTTPEADLITHIRVPLIPAATPAASMPR